MITVKIQLKHEDARQPDDDCDEYQNIEVEVDPGEEPEITVEPGNSYPGSPPTWEAELPLTCATCGYTFTDDEIDLMVDKINAAIRSGDYEQLQ